MKDSRRRATTVRAALLLAALTTATGLSLGCGGNGSPSSGVAEREVHAKATAESTGANGTARGVRGGNASLATAASEELTATLSPESQPSAPFLCTKDPVAFDLSALLPSESTPTAFAEAWADVRRRSDVPGFVVAYSGTATGPNIEARVGSVHPVAAGMYAFQNILPPSDIETVLLEPTDPFHLISVHGTRKFVTAFGKVKQREGFVISSITVDGRLDSNCEFLHRVVVQMVLPRDNVKQPFGGTTMDVALGALNEDSDNDGVLDSWRVTMQSPSLANLMFRL